MAESKDGELYLVDGSGFIFRAYYAMAYGGKPMTNPDGVPVGAVFGFTNMLLKMLRDYNAPYMAVIFDAARKNFRNDIYADYKANRDETPEDLVPQFPLIRDAVAAFDIPYMAQEGYEADDLIAAYTRLAREAGKKVVIVSSDKDLMQLIGDGVRMLDPMKGEFIGIEQVQEKFGVMPDKVGDVLALAGDTSDNVPGVPGIGVKTAAQLINEFGDLETLLARAGEIKQQKRRETIQNNIENARLSKKLVSLDDHAPVPMQIEELKTHSEDKPELVAFLKKHGFNSIMKRLSVSDVATAPQIVTHAQVPAPVEVEEKPVPIDPSSYTLINDEKILKEWIAAAYESGILCFDTETTSLTPAKAELVGISLAYKAGKAAYIPIGHTQEMDLLGEAKNTIKQLPKKKVIELLKPLLEDESVLKVAHNAKYDWQMFAKEGVDITPIDDTMLISYVLDGTAHPHGMDYLSETILGHKPISYEAVAGKGKNQVTFDKVPVEKALAYAAEDADVTLRLHKILKPRLAREKMVSVYEDIERPLISVIGRMELDGIRVDPQILKSMSNDFGKKLVELETEIHKLAGTQFNISSPKQVGEILFKNMGLQGGKKTSKGDFSTSVDVLEKLADEGHEIVKKILWSTASFQN
jgi:DNA polymerase-1